MSDKNHSGALPDLSAPAPSRWFESLSIRLFALTLVSILIVEALIFVPSASGFRNAWLQERVQAARIAALALEASPARNVSEELSDQLLTNAEVLAVTELEDDMRIQLLAAQTPIAGQMHNVDLRNSNSVSRSAATLGAFFAPDDRVLVIFADGSALGRVLEIVVPQAPMKAALWAYARRIAALSLLIAFVAAGIIYVMLHFLVVRPMRRVTLSAEQFRNDPGAWTRRLQPTPRRDEIGRAQNALADMEDTVATSFRNRAHLAELGTAVAKINHDLRNSLASAQLVSDVLARSEDPRVQNAAPRLERALERAISLATETLDYGKATPQPARPEQFRLHAAVEEAAAEALAAHPRVQWKNLVPPDVDIMADPDHLHRIVANLLRNAAEAMDSIESGERRITATLTPAGLDIIDTGPGLPDSACETLFKPFAGSSRRNGTGLGLVIARELAQGMGGDLLLASTSPSGTTFCLQLPGYGA
ncbi:sensor histidine kinase [Hyphomonas johnsonii]|uniref:histidine kinase n=1 Tax=Hyphomonas johnsonii MHS-2 TaxID=1280950 RepID=A0A059FN44_9PROT|nr:HAMP domain-containing sensor histidine kinase [Hyphomonas johnsonii]KCZ92090.1 sensor histidine kinase [Hyphomonas johnsonii MHS-2]